MMKKTLIEVNYSKLNEDSVIVFKNGKWTAVSKTAFLDNVHKELDDLNNKITTESNERKEDINNIQNDIKDIKNQLKLILGEDENEEE